MFKQLLFLAILIFIPPLSFAQVADHTFEASIEEGQIYIIVQMQIRDSNQNLIGYIETDRVTVENLEQLSGIMDEISTNPKNTKIINIDETKYQVITEESNLKYNSDRFLSISYIFQDGESIAYVNYDGFQLKAGDAVISTWTLVRPA